MRLFPFLFLLFVLIYIEISLFIAIANHLGILSTLLLLIFSSCMGISLIRNKGLKTLAQMQQKLEIGENPASEMVKSVSLLIAGILLFIPGFFTDGLGLLLLLPPVQKLLTLRLIPYARFSGSFSSRRSSSNQPQQHTTIEGEYTRKDDE